MPCPRPRLPARDVAGIVREQPELPSAELLSRLSPSPDTLRTGRCGSRIRPDVVAALRPNAEPPRARSAVRPPRLMKRSAQRQKRARPCSPFIRRRPHPNPHSAPPAPCDTTSSAPARRLGTYLLDNPPSSAPGRTATGARSRGEGTSGPRASSLRPPAPRRIEWQPALRGRTLDVRPGEDVGPAVRTRRRLRQSPRRPRTAHGSPGTPPPPSLNAPDSPPEDAPPVAGCRSPLHRHALDVVRQDSLRREYTMMCSASTSVFFTHRTVYAGLYGSSTKPPVTGWTTRTRRSPETRCA